jgi:hypothetical protein
MTCARSTYAQPLTVESRARLVKVLNRLHVREQLAAVDKVHHQIEFVRRLEREMQRHEEGMPHLLQNASLGFDVLGVVLLDDRLLVHHFHSVDSLGVFLAHLNHLSKAAIARSDKPAISHTHLPFPITFNKSKSSNPILL